MKHMFMYILWFCLFPLNGTLFGQFNPSTAGEIDQGKIVFHLDRRWTNDQKIEFSRFFDLDSTVLEKAFSGVSEFLHDSIKWNVFMKDRNIVELFRYINDDAIPEAFETDVLLLEDDWFEFVQHETLPAAVFGINNFTKSDVFSYENGVACLRLPGYSNAKSVFLSGSFNDWLTTGIPMKKENSVWEVCLPLSAGKYNYKFIVDGRWIVDPNNKNREEIDKGKSAFFFCYNHKFVLNGFQNRKKIFVTGSFNEWDENELLMNRTAEGWELPVYLREGTHFYKFIADYEWLTDPANKNVRFDSHGNLNSYIEMGDTLMFRLHGYTSARSVLLSGTFNNWSINELLMNKTSDGWELKYVTAPGNYEYKFIVDDRWIEDPQNPYKSGSGDYLNSFVSFKPNHVFSLSGYPDAKSVIVTGSFNGWYEEGYRMEKKNDIWTLPIRLNPGKHVYKFIVDGNWILDPDNEYWEENEFGTGNSVLWIKQ